MTTGDAVAFEEAEIMTLPARRMCVRGREVCVSGALSRGLCCTPATEDAKCSTEQRPGRGSVRAMTSNSIYSPVRQFELMRNIHFQSLTSSVLALPGNGRTSLPSPLPMKPRTPLSLGRPYSFRYNHFHNWPSRSTRCCRSLFSSSGYNSDGVYIPDCLALVSTSYGS